MVSLVSLKDVDIFKHAPKQWPTQDNFVNVHNVTEMQYREFELLLANKPSETEVEKFLAKNKEVLALTEFLFQTGHHAAWVYSKQQIRVSGKNITGKIPDYILAGANSDGVSWFVLELKGPNEKIFSQKGKSISFTSVANRGICQLLEYIDISSRSQAYLRDELNLKNFREPKGILLIGSEEEFENEQAQELKAAWNRMNSKLQIVTYDRLLRIVRHKIAHKMNQDTTSYESS